MSCLLFQISPGDSVLTLRLEGAASGLKLGEIWGTPFEHLHL